jgi:hypothetical protein
MSRHGWLIPELGNNTNGSSDTAIERQRKSRGAMLVIDDQSELILLILSVFNQIQSREEGIKWSQCSIALQSGQGEWNRQATASHTHNSLSER